MENPLKIEKDAFLLNHPEMTEVIDHSPVELLLAKDLRFQRISPSHWIVLLDALEPELIRQEPGIAFWYKQRNISAILLLEWNGTFYQGCIENCRNGAFKDRAHGSRLAAC